MSTKTLDVVMNYYQRYAVEVDGRKIVSLEFFSYPGPYQAQPEAPLGEVTLKVGAPWRPLSTQQKTWQVAEFIAEMRNLTT